MNKVLPAYEVHPVSIKMIKKGHPWIIKDKFTDKFHPRDRFIMAKDKGRPFALLLHDPKHDRVKARLWSNKGDFANQRKNFRKETSLRLQAALDKRRQLGCLQERENVYLVFGEADRLPGARVQLLGKELLVQFYSYFWEDYADFFVERLLKEANATLGLDLSKDNVWLQLRADGNNPKNRPRSLNPNRNHLEFEIEEFGIKYKLELGKRYDCGIYTDMAAVRALLKSEFEAAKSVLNLYSYTGAFSLYALKHQAQKVVSVDLSGPYLETLKENIRMNRDLAEQNHFAMETSSKQALSELAANQEKFDLIVSDPPSSSSDGNKRTNALQNYERELPRMAKLLAPKGKILVFLNTNKVSRNKFESKVQQIIENNKLGLKVEKRIGLSGDCPTLKGFPEGAYLKGLALVHD